MKTFHPLRIATRQSQLALWQANYVKQQLLNFYPQLIIELVQMLTSGDRHMAPLNNQGGKSLFVKELQAALLASEADLAVHSIKDLSVNSSPSLQLAAICKRADPRDVLISANYNSLSHLPLNAKIGTTSPRRQCQLLAIRPDLTILPLRGNIDTRVQKAAAGEFDAIVLAAAGLHRLGLDKQIVYYFNPTEFIPAIGQGAIGIECRTDDAKLQELLQLLNHEPTAICVAAERAVNQRLGGDCFTPVAAHAVLDENNEGNDELFLSAMVGSLDGKYILQESMCGNKKEAEKLGFELAEQLLKQGADKLL